MKLLDEIRLAERVERPNGEELYRIAGFREQLEALNEGILIVEDCILTPITSMMGRCMSCMNMR